DAVLHDHQVGGADAVHLDADPVVPLDDAAQLLAVLEDDDHGSARVHLLEVVERLRVGLLRRHLLAARRALLHALLQLREVRPDQLSVDRLAGRAIDVRSESAGGRGLVAGFVTTHVRTSTRALRVERAAPSIRLWTFESN